MIIAIVAATFLVMEFVAWAMHKYVMHGFLWVLHEDHHDTEHHVIEKNDAFFLMFAIPSMLLFIFGSLGGYDYRFWIGLGILLYGICYTLVHDGLIHQRYKIFTHTNNTYFRAIRKAHAVHHKKLGKEDGECFGMLIVPLKYFKEATAYKKRKASAA